MCIDLDNFKRVNEFGHATGDSILERSAAELRASVRTTDVAARIGGDEFAVLLKDDLDGIAAEMTAGEFLSRMRVLAREVDGTDLGASIGFVVGSAGWSADEPLKAADDAMYSAKHDQKGSFVMRRLEPSSQPEN